MINISERFVKLANHLFGELKLMVIFGIFYLSSSFMAFFVFFSYLQKRIGLRFKISDIVSFNFGLEPNLSFVLKIVFILILLFILPWWLALQEKSDRLPKNELDPDTKFYIEYEYGLYFIIYGLSLALLLLILSPLRPFVKFNRTYVTTGRFDINKAKRYFGEQFFIWEFKPYVYCKLVGIKPINKFTYIGVSTKLRHRGTVIVSYCDIVGVFNIQSNPKFLRNSIETITSKIEHSW